MQVGVKMQIGSNSAGVYAHQDIALQIKTSSGDLIDLSMYKEASAAYSESSDGTSYTKTSELSFSQGYKFHYEGNGISEQDQKEIDEALKKFKPEIEKFMAKSGGDESVKNTSKPEDWLASLGSGIMPTPKDDNMKNAQKSQMAKAFDEMMKKFSSNMALLSPPKNDDTQNAQKPQAEQGYSPLEKVFNDSKRLLDKIFSLMDGETQIQYA